MTETVVPTLVEPAVGVPAWLACRPVDCRLLILCLLVGLPACISHLLLEVLPVLRKGSSPRTFGLKLDRGRLEDVLKQPVGLNAC